MASSQSATPRLRNGSPCLLVSRFLENEREPAPPPPRRCELLEDKPRRNRTAAQGQRQRGRSHCSRLFFFFFFDGVRQAKKKKSKSRSQNRTVPCLARPPRRDRGCACHMRCPGAVEKRTWRERQNSDRALSFSFFFLFDAQALELFFFFCDSSSSLSSLHFFPPKALETTNFFVSRVCQLVRMADPDSPASQTLSPVLAGVLAYVMTACARYEKRKRIEGSPSSPSLSTSDERRRRCFSFSAAASTRPLFFRNSSMRMPQILVCSLPCASERNRKPKASVSKRPRVLHSPKLM